RCARRPQALLESRIARCTGRAARPPAPPGLRKADCPDRESRSSHQRVATAIATAALRCRIPWRSQGYQPFAARALEPDTWNLFSPVLFWLAAFQAATVSAGRTASP